jgi:hypothetical protein
MTLSRGAVHCGLGPPFMLASSRMAAKKTSRWRVQQHNHVHSFFWECFLLESHLSCVRVCTSSCVYLLLV